MRTQFQPVRAAVVVCAIACTLAFSCLDSPGAPKKATTAQIDQMNQESGAGSSNFAAAPPDWPAMSRAIRTARDSLERVHWIAEFAHHAIALPESLRTQRFVELKQLMREGR